MDRDTAEFVNEIRELVKSVPDNPAYASEVRKEILKLCKDYGGITTSDVKPCDRTAFLHSLSLYIKKEAYKNQIVT